MWFNERLYVFLLYRYQSGSDSPGNSKCLLCVSSHNARVFVVFLHTRLSLGSKGHDGTQLVKILGRPLRPQYVKLTEGEEGYCVVCNHTNSVTEWKSCRSQATQPPHTNMYATHMHALTQEFKAQAVKTLWAVERFCTPCSSACYHSTHRKRISDKS